MEVFMSINNFSGNISPEKLDALLKIASEKLGMPKDQLKAAVSNPKMASELLEKLGNKNNLKSAISNPQTLEKLLNNNPKAKEMLHGILEDKKDG